MMPVSGNATTAAALFRNIAETAAGNPHREQTDRFTAMIRAANSDGPEGDEPQSTEERKAEINAAFGVNHVTTTERKLAIFKDVGRELGVDESRFDDAREFASAVGTAFRRLKQSENGAAIIAGIERKLGLDELGVTLEDVVTAMNDTDGKSDRKLTDALEAEYGSDEDRNDVERLARQNERLSLYSPFS